MLIIENTKLEEYKKTFDEEKARKKAEIEKNKIIDTVTSLEQYYNEKINKIKQEYEVEIKQEYENKSKHLSDEINILIEKKNTLINEKNKDKVFYQLEFKKYDKNIKIIYSDSNKLIIKSIL